MYEGNIETEQCPGYCKKLKHIAGSCSSIVKQTINKGD